MEIKNIHKHAGWYASYSEDQGKALILCQQSKIKQLQDILNKISIDLELRDNPRADSDSNILNSIEHLVSNIKTISHTENFFKWEG